MNKQNITCKWREIKKYPDSYHIFRTQCLRLAFYGLDKGYCFNCKKKIVEVKND